MTGTGNRASRKGGNTGGGFDLAVFAKSVNDRLAAIVKNKNATVLSADGLSYLYFMERNTDMKTIVERILNQVIEERLTPKEKLRIESMPIWERGERKNNLKEAFLENEDLRNYLKSRVVEYQERMMEYRLTQAGYLSYYAYKRGMGPLGQIPPSADIRTEYNFTLENPEVRRLVEMHDGDYIASMATGSPGAGKTNYVLRSIRFATDLHYGYLPTHIMGARRPKVTVYMPGHEFREGLDFSYLHPWEIYIDEPKGASVLWKKWEKTQAEEDYGGVRHDVFAIVYLGELGAGMLQSADSGAVRAYRQTFSLSRQMAVRPIMASADRIAKNIMIDFVQPQIFLASDSGQNGPRTVKAEYLLNQGKEVKVVQLGRITEDPLVRILNKGISSDFTADIEAFQIKDIMSRTGITNLKKYLKNPDDVISEFSREVLIFDEDWREQWGHPPRSQEKPPKPRSQGTEAIQEEEQEESHPPQRSSKTDF